MIGQREMGLDEYVAIAQRRKWWIIIPALVLPALAYLVSLKIPEKYTSITLVLVEEQKVPDTFVKPVVTEDLNERLSTMQEQILSRTRLEPLIDRFGLFKGEVGKVPMEDLVDKMRKSISIVPIRPDTESRTKGMPGFYISYTAESPRIAQQVCSEITSMFMTENLRARIANVEGTSDFLTKQLEDAKRSLDEQDAKLAAFKSKYIGQLPGEEQGALTMLPTLTTQLDAATQNLNRAQQDKTYTESLLSQELAAWHSQSADNSTNPETLEQQLTTLQAQLVSLQGKYTADHPDVIKTKRQIEQIKKQIASDSKAAEKTPTDKPKNDASLAEPPRIQEMRLRIHQYENQIATATLEQKRLQTKIREVQAKIQSSPAVEEQYKNLTRDYETAQKFYDDLLSKQKQSEIAANLEKAQQGEQFRIMDPPNLPERPTFPNRPMIAGGGFAGGLALGVGVVFLMELKDKALRTDKDVQFFLKIPTLGQLPQLEEEVGKKSGGVTVRFKRSKPISKEAVGA